MLIADLVTDCHERTGRTVQATSGFAREFPEDASLLFMIRPSDSRDGEPHAAFQQTLAEMNVPLIERARTHRTYTAAAIHGAPMRSREPSP